MLSRIRRLERILAKELAQLAVIEHTEKLVAQWRKATDRSLPLPDPRKFLGGIIKAGYMMQHSGAVHSYLDKCARSNKLPDERIIFQALLPWRYAYPSYSRRACSQG